MNAGRLLQVLETPRNGLMVGTVTGFTEEGQALALFEGESDPVPALCAASLTRTVVEGAVKQATPGLFLCSDTLSSPLLLDFISFVPAAEPVDHVHPPDLPMARARLELQAKEAIELRCGDACIALEQDGRVVIRGNEILSRARGQHRIRGACIKLN